MCKSLNQDSGMALLESDSFLNQRVVVARNAFIRGVGDDFLAWCPRSGASFVVNNASPLGLALRGDPKCVNEIISWLSAYMECPFATVLEWYGPLLKELAKERLVDVLDGVGMIEKPDSLAEGNNREVIGYGERLNVAADPIDEFYATHHLPIELHLDLTDACTERCVHCYVPREQKHFLPLELAEKVLTEFREMDGITVHLSGGEVMMHPDFERICRKCVELNLNLIILSNMTLADERRIKFLKEIDPQVINVSVYSMKPEEHDAITQLPGSWARTIKALELCDRYGIFYRISTPLLKENQTAFGELKKFADVHHVRLAAKAEIVAQSDHGCGNLAHVCSPKELQKVLECNREMFNENWSEEMPSVDAKVCDIGELRIYLNAKGDYYPCGSMHEYVLGNVRENTMVEVWKGEKLNYLRGLKNRDFGACASCENRPWCKVCPAANFNATGDLFRHHSGACALSGVVKEVYGGKTNAA